MLDSSQNAPHRAQLGGPWFALLADRGFFQDAGIIGVTPIPLWFTAAYAAILISTTALLAFQCWKVLPAPLSKVASLQASADAFLTEHIQRLTQGRRLTRGELGILATYRPQA